MSAGFGVDVQTVVALFLASVRFLAVMMAAPIFAHTAMSSRIRLGFAVLAAALVPADAAVSLGTATLALALLHEVVVGLAIGFSLSLVFAGISLMGELVSVQGGLGAAAAIDPASGANSLALSTLLQSIALLLFLVIDGHHIVVRASYASFGLFPIGGGAIDPAGFIGIASAASLIFAVGLRFAAPLTALMLVVNTSVGALGRAIPQLNLMSIHLPAQIALLLFVLGLSAPLFIDELSITLIEQSDIALAAFVGSR